MRNISEHDSEQERECYQRKHRWVRLFVSRNSICFHYDLSALCKFISLKISGCSLLF